MGSETLLSMARQSAINLVQHEPQAITCTLIFALCNGKERAHLAIATGKDFSEAWRNGAVQINRWSKTQSSPPIWLRVEVVKSVTQHHWSDLLAEFAKTKRNYFERGIAFNSDLSTAILAQEIGASAILYDSKLAECCPNPINLKNYSKKRFGKELSWPEDGSRSIWTFTTQGVFTDGKEVHVIEDQGRHQGYRKITQWNAAFVADVASKATGYLARQVKDSGEYYYGWFPCFDRPIPSYNALRHASSTYALIEGWEQSRRPNDKEAIDRALNYLASELIRELALPNGDKAAFLVDVGDEIKLGGNAVCLLAFVKYTEVTGDKKYLPLLEKLALGVLHMQDPSSGRFVHVLHYPDLKLVAENRIIYYDGEAAFGLMRLYGLTKDDRWLQAVEKGFDYFISAKHWQAHDHWLSYCVNELTLYRPEERYFKFGLDNVRDHLDFVIERITTFPTLLELMMAAQKMITRMEQDERLSLILDSLDKDKFYRALENRARYLLNGFFWPERAMFFRNPSKILDGFFIRHHSYRVRIDDVEHYLSGYVAYSKYLEKMAGKNLDVN